MARAVPTFCRDTRSSGLWTCWARVIRIKERRRKIIGSVRKCWWSVPVYSQKGKAQTCLHLRALAASANSLLCGIWWKWKLLRCLIEIFIVFKSVSKNLPYSDFKYTQENFTLLILQFVFLSQLTKPHSIFTVVSATPHFALKHTLKNEAWDSQTLLQNSEEKANYFMKDYLAVWDPGLSSSWVQM